MKLLQILNEIEVRNIRPYTITVPIIDEDTGEVIGNRKVLVYPEDSDKEMMNWDKAKEACKELGDGWRLPTKEELEAMYKQLHIEGKGNFMDGAWYWSSSIESEYNYIWVVDFTSGDAYYNEDEFGQVRAVRSTT